MQKAPNIGGTNDYSYNSRDELTGATYSNNSSPDESYSYDANGNRVISSLHGEDYVIGGNNQLTTDSIYTYEYDDEGNLIRQMETATGDVRVFEWDYHNRLVAVIDLDATGTELQQVAYTYDVMGRRIAKAVDADGAGNATAESLRFVYDRENVSLEFKGDVADLSMRYLHGPQVDQVLAQEDATGTLLWHLSDHLGSVKDLVDDIGILKNHLTFNSYGNVIGESDDGFSSRYGFTGRELDEETGLYYYRARYFDSEIGRFISQDPIDFASGTENFYEYVENSPIASKDPFGLAATIIPRTQVRTIFYEDNGRRATNTIRDVKRAQRQGKRKKKSANVCIAEG